MYSGLCHIFTMVLFSWGIIHSDTVGDLKILICFRLMHISHFPVCFSLGWVCTRTVWRMILWIWFSNKWKLDSKHHKWYIKLASSMHLLQSSINYSAFCRNRFDEFEKPIILIISWSFFPANGKWFDIAILPWCVKELDLSYRLFSQCRTHN